MNCISLVGKYFLCIYFFEVNVDIGLFREDATTASTAFCLRYEKDDQKVVLEDKDLEVIGTAIIKYGDSTVIVQHSESGLWLSYKVNK